MNDSTRNIKFNYLYRDAGNYKLFDSVIFTNTTEMSLEFVKLTIRSKMIDNQFFIPENWNIPRLSFRDYSPESDHDFHEFESIEETNEQSNAEDISDFLRRIL